jgi:hypothetical protein
LHSLLSLKRDEEAIYGLKGLKSTASPCEVAHQLCDSVIVPTKA